MNNMLIICGPTATGKTDLAIMLAKKFNGEIVSADSRQVYKGMDIVTGKDIPASAKCKVQSLPAGKAGAKLKIKEKNYDIGFRQKEGVPIWLVDVCRPDQEFSVSHYVRFANAVIADIQSRNKLPIIVGGTGFYIKALTENIDSINIKPNLKLRARLEKLNLNQLQHELKSIWEQRFNEMNNSDINNPRRLIRAIEIGSVVCQPNLNNKSGQLGSKNIILNIGLKLPIINLIDNIIKRVKDRINSGALIETKNLLKIYSNDNVILKTTLGYKQLFNYLNRQTTKSEAIDLWQQVEIAYAKRQLVWFKKIKDILWFDIQEKDYQKQIEKTVQAWYDRSDAKKN